VLLLRDKRDPFSSPTDFRYDETVPPQGAGHGGFLTSQDPGENYVAPRGKMPGPDRQRVDQNLAEDICCDDVELSGELVRKDITPRDVNVSDPVEARVSLRRRAGEGIVVDGKHAPGPEITAGDCKNSAASAGIEHPPIRSETPGDLFQQTQAHRGGGMLARAESRFGGNNKWPRLRRLRRGRLFFWRPQNDKARTDA
jgi:hypothetical protein